MMKETRARLALGNFVFAHVQAPWRTQRQWIGALLLAVLGLGMVAALYLSVTSRAAIAGRQIQDLANQLVALQQANADLESRLAQVTSSEVMQERALALGFEPVDSADLLYLPVPGYQQPEPAILAGTRSPKPTAANLPPEYSESLIVWLNRSLKASLGIRARVIP